MFRTIEIQIHIFTVARRAAGFIINLVKIMSIVICQPYHMLRVVLNKISMCMRVIIDDTAAEMIRVSLIWISEIGPIGNANAHVISAIL